MRSQMGILRGLNCTQILLQMGKVFIMTADKAPKKILIFDVLGTQVMQTTLLREELNVSELDAGVYVLRVYEKNKIATRKLIIK